MKLKSGLWWNGGRPWLYDGERYQFMGSGLSMEAWQRWCVAKGVQFINAPIWVRISLDGEAKRLSELRYRNRI